MNPTYTTPFRAEHSNWGPGTVVRTDSDGIGRTRRPVFRPDRCDEYGDPVAERAAWGDLEPTDDFTSSSVKVEGNTATVQIPSVEKPKLGAIGDLIRECGLDPDEWLINVVVLNKWLGMTAPQYDPEHGEKRNALVPLRQWKVTLVRKPHLTLALPAQHVPIVPRKPGPPRSERPELIVVESDHQIPYHDPDLHEASLNMLADLTANHRLAELVFGGDTGDNPTISKHADHPAAMVPVNEGLQCQYDVIRAKSEATPGVRKRKLKGNHDWRLEAELLARAERLYDIKPADTSPDKPELPALSLRRLLHLDALDVELVEDQRGWEHAEIELVSGSLGLVVRHGWLVGQNTALKSLRARGRSIIVGHKHTIEHVFEYDAGVGAMRQAVVNSVMCRVRDVIFPHFAVCDNWSQGCVIVTRWPDGQFQIEHALWNGKTLNWRDQRWEA